MPLGIVVTNLKGAAIPDDFLSRFSKLVAEQLKTEEKNVVAHLRPDQHVIHGGSSAPNGYIELYFSPGFGDVKNKRKITKTLLDFVKEKLQLQGESRFFVILKVPPAEDLGFEGGLLSDLSK